MRNSLRPLHHRGCRWARWRTWDRIDCVYAFVSDDFGRAEHSSLGSNCVSFWPYDTDFQVIHFHIIGVINHLKTGSLMEAYRCISCRMRSDWVDAPTEPKSLRSAARLATSDSGSRESGSVFDFRRSSSIFRERLCKEEKTLDCTWIQSNESRTSI